MFGGQVLGQALHAAQLSMPHGSDTVPVSLHSYFLQRGRPQNDIIYRIREKVDLRSFHTRSVDAIQQGNIIFQMQAQFAKTGEQSAISHADPMPELSSLGPVLPPDRCPSMADMLASLLTRAPKAMHALIEEMRVAPVDVRYACGELPDPLDLQPTPKSSRQLLWVRIRDPVHRRTGLDECCAAYLSDQPLLLTSLRPHGLQFPSPRLGAVATLDHSMWFHGPFHSDKWLLCAPAC